MWIIYTSTGDVVGTSSAKPNIEDIESGGGGAIETNVQLDLANGRHKVVDGSLIVDTSPTLNYNVRPYRDKLLSDAQALVDRYDNQLRIGVTPNDSETRIKAILQYMQVLRDIPAIYAGKALEEISWPEFPK